jgi:hypothetical protein
MKVLLFEEYRTPTATNYQRKKVIYRAEGKKQRSKRRKKKLISYTRGERKSRLDSTAIPESREKYFVRKSKCSWDLGGLTLEKHP